MHHYSYRAFTIVPSAEADPASRCVIDGEIDMTVVQAFRTALFDEVRAGATTTIDLSNVTFLGVGGLRALVEAREWAAQHDCRLHLVASPVVWRMLEIIGKAGDFNR